MSVTWNSSSRHVQCTTWVSVISSKSPVQRKKEGGKEKSFSLSRDPSSGRLKHTLDSNCPSQPFSQAGHLNLLPFFLCSSRNLLMRWGFVFCFFLALPPSPLPPPPFTASPPSCSIAGLIYVMLLEWNLSPKIVAQPLMFYMWNLDYTLQVIYGAHTGQPCWGNNSKLFY